MEAKKRPWSACTHLLAPSSSAYLGEGEGGEGVGVGVGVGLDVDVAEHVVADVAAHLNLLNPPVSGGGGGVRNAGGAGANFMESKQC